jgi:hypothetical protein
MKKENKKNKKYKNGFLYNIVKLILNNIRHITLIEWFKIIGVRVFCGKDPEVHTRVNCRSNIVDFYNILKWLLIIFLLSYQKTSTFWTITVWYLLITNLYSYFYHHIWSDNAISLNLTSPDRARRRFFLLLLAIGYSIFCFSYLYKLPYINEFCWSGDATFTKSLWFSVSSSFAANYETVKPLSELGNSISMIELVITFIFVTIIISKTIPEVKK